MVYPFVALKQKLRVVYPTRFHNKLQSGTKKNNVNNRLSGDDLQSHSVISSSIVSEMATNTK